MREQQLTARKSSTRSRSSTTTSRWVTIPPAQSSAKLTSSNLPQTYGSPDSPKYRKAQANFIKSLASYSVICYLLQLKDRHNGNILVNRDGHLIRASAFSPAGYL